MLDDITDAVLYTQKLVCKGFKAQADLIEEQTKEIKHKINRQTDILTDEIADVISTITECCESLHDEIYDIQELICRGFKEFDCILTLQTELLACNITELDDLKQTVVECCDDLADDIFDTQTLIIACCKSKTQSLIEECCEEMHSTHY